MKKLSIVIILCFPFLLNSANALFFYEPPHSEESNDPDNKILQERIETLEIEVGDITYSDVPSMRGKITDLESKAATLNNVCQTLTVVCMQYAEQITNLEKIITDLTDPKRKHENHPKQPKITTFFKPYPLKKPLQSINPNYRAQNLSEQVVNTVHQPLG